MSASQKDKIIDQLEDQIDALKTERDQLKIENGWFRDENKRLRDLIPQAWVAGLAHGENDKKFNEWMKQKGLI